MGLVRAALLILALGAAPVRPPDHTGYAVRYAPRVMQSVALNRGIIPVAHMAAYTYAQDRDMGRRWLHITGPAGEADFLVVDLPQPRDRPGLIKRGIVAELDFASGPLICGKHWTGRARDCPVRIWVA